MNVEEGRVLGFSCLPFVAREIATLTGAASVIVTMGPFAVSSPVSMWHYVSQHALEGEDTGVAFIVPDVFMEITDETIAAVLRDLRAYGRLDVGARVYPPRGPGARPDGKIRRPL